MNKRPIEEARDPDLRQSPQAMRRAAQRAHELAWQTGTFVIVSRNGAVEQLLPKQTSISLAVETPGSSYGDKE